MLKTIFGRIDGYLIFTSDNILKFSGFTNKMPIKLLAIVKKFQKF